MTTYQAQKKHFPGAGKFDKINSTFRSKIIFNETQKVPYLDGYSKGLLQKEPEDKIFMLQNWIVRLYNCGHLSAHKTVRIEFFEKTFLNNNDELFLVLEPYNYVVTKDKYILNVRLNKFLSELYKGIKSGQPVTKNLVDKKLRFNEDEVFSLKEKRFTDENECREWCIKKIKEGIYTEGQIKHFYYQWKNKYSN